MKRYRTMACGLLLPMLCGCALNEIVSKSKFGPEFRHKGSRSTDEVRWYVQQGFDFKWENGIKTGITYRRRDVDDGGGDHDNGVWFDIAIPIWKAEKKPDALVARVAKLERRLAELEGRRHTEPGE